MYVVRRQGKEAILLNMCLFPVGISCINIMHAAVKGAKESSKKGSQCVPGLWLIQMRLFYNVEVTSNNCKLHVSVVSAICRSGCLSVSGTTQQDWLFPSHLHPPPHTVKPSSSYHRLWNPFFLFHLISLFFLGEEWAPEWRFPLLEGCDVRLI